jgi:hypothetical protein
MRQTSGSVCYTWGYSVTGFLVAPVMWLLHVATGLVYYLLFPVLAIT